METVKTRKLLIPCTPVQVTNVTRYSVTGCHQIRPSLWFPTRKRKSTGQHQTSSPETKFPQYPNSTRFQIRCYQVENGNNSWKRVEAGGRSFWVFPTVVRMKIMIYQKLKRVHNCLRRTASVFIIMVRPTTDSSKKPNTTGRYRSNASHGLYIETNQMATDKKVHMPRRKFTEPQQNQRSVRSLFLGRTERSALLGILW